MPKTLLEFKETRDTGKTKVWDVFAAAEGIRLGEIHWYAPWRRYVFEPCFATLFDRNCLMEIVDFIEKQMIARKP